MTSIAHKKNKSSLLTAKLLFATITMLIIHASAQARPKTNDLSLSEIQLQANLDSPSTLEISPAERCSLSFSDTLIAPDGPSDGNTADNALNYIGYFNSLDDNLNCLNQLLAAGIDINQQDVDGYTPLIKLLYSQSDHTVALISYMLKQGANPLIRSHSGMDLQHHALTLQLLYTKQLSNLAEDDPMYIAADKMVTTTQHVRTLYAEFYLSQQKNKIEIRNRK